MGSGRHEFQARNYSDIMRSLAAKYHNNNNSPGTNNSNEYGFPENYAFESILICFLIFFLSLQPIQHEESISRAKNANKSAKILHRWSPTRQ